jgi:hypothetical protein
LYTIFSFQLELSFIFEHFLFSDNMKFITAAAVILGVASAAPTDTIEKRAQQCGQWDNKVSGAYTLYQDLWGISGYSGSQCSDISSSSGGTLNWWTTYVFPTCMPIAQLTRS